MQEIFSVSTLTSVIKKNLESSFSKIQVKGEVSNLKEQSSGHLYFTLKDPQAQIAAVLFKNSGQGLARPLKNGDQVVLGGELNVYPPRGAYQIVVRSVTFLGLGELLLQLHALKTKLEGLGWFRAEHKKPLPRFPRVIGVVTSPTGSVIQDILHVLQRRLQGFHLILYPVKVQGDGAASEIAEAIDAFNRYQLADVLIVGRGGGSLEDLWAFNEEKVASALHHSKIPIISAVGHETDMCMADFVADVRAPTPSAAAEIATGETAQHLYFLQQTRCKLQGQVLTLLNHHKKRQEQYKRHPLLANPGALIEPLAQSLDEMKEDLTSSMRRLCAEKGLLLEGLKKQVALLRPDTSIALKKNQLETLSCGLKATLLQQIQLRRHQLGAVARMRALDQLMLTSLQRKKEGLGQLISHLKGIDPKKLLTKGYCILFRENSPSVILSITELKKEERLLLQMHDGKAVVTCSEICP